MSVDAILHSVSSHFRTHNIDHALIGALALQAYGYVRSTRDIDFVVRARDQNRVAAFLTSLGFEQIHLTASFSNHVHSIDSLRVDMMYVDKSTGDHIFSATRFSTVFGSEKIPVTSPQHLLAMKLFSAHSNPDRLLKDLADAKELIRNTGIEQTVVRELAMKYDLQQWAERIVNE